MKPLFVEVAPYSNRYSNAARPPNDLWLNRTSAGTRLRSPDARRQHATWDSGAAGHPASTGISTSSVPVPGAGSQLSGAVASGWTLTLSERGGRLLGQCLEKTVTWNGRS